MRKNNNNKINFYGFLMWLFGFLHETETHIPERQLKSQPEILPFLMRWRGRFCNGLFFFEQNAQVDFSLDRFAVLKVHNLIISFSVSGGRR